MSKKTDVDVNDDKRYFDSISGLPNRLSLLAKLAALVGIKKDHELGFAVFFIDINQFHTINVNFGNATGDRVLQLFANKLRQIPHKLDYVARVGDDEFVVVCRNLALEEVNDLAKKFIDLFDLPLKIDKHEIQLGISIGISLFPSHGLTADDLLNNAICALRSAKLVGGSVYVFYAPQLREDANKVFAIEKNLRSAIANDEFKLLYQPIINIATMHVESFEVLLRWNSKDLGIVDPDVFVRLAEKRGIIADVADWVFARAVQQYAHWGKQHPQIQLPKMSLNCSVSQLQNPDFFDNLTTQLQDLAVKNDNIILEITETMLFNDTEVIHKQINNLHGAGFKIAIDDFGTGFSSLSHVRSIPVQVLKIDKSFVDDILINQSDAAVVSAILHLGEQLQISVVAEGIQTKQQAQFLRGKGCKLMQGFLFAKPLQDNDFIEFLQKFQYENFEDLLIEIKD